jgi:hypothetical protein
MQSHSYCGRQARKSTKWLRAVVLPVGFSIVGTEKFGLVENSGWPSLWLAFS